ncbi:hypothetical protein AFGD_004642 [Aspergillus flavus]|nr:hypothetical protein AFGD_004642 [Aspergillus flavus]
MPRISPSQTEPELVHSDLRVWMVRVTGPAEEGGENMDLETMAVIIISVERRQHEIQVETWVPSASVAPGVVSIFSLALICVSPSPNYGCVDQQKRKGPDKVAVMPPGLYGFRKSLFLRDKFLSLLKWSTKTPEGAPRIAWDRPVHAVNTGVNDWASGQFVELSADVVHLASSCQPRSSAGYPTLERLVSSIWPRNAVNLRQPFGCSASTTTAS